METEKAKKCAHPNCSCAAASGLWRKYPRTSCWVMVEPPWGNTRARSEGAPAIEFLWWANIARGLDLARTRRKTE
jgi:hypothetical protein